MAKIHKATHSRLPFQSVKVKTRAFVLGALGLIPAACQSPVARFIPAQTVRELQEPTPQKPLDHQAVAQEIAKKTDKKSVALAIVKSWGEGLGLSGYSMASLPSLIAMDVSFLSFYSQGPNHRFRSSISAATSTVFDHKIPSYTSGLIDNSDIRNIRKDNAKIDEGEEKK